MEEIPVWISFKKKYETFIVINWILITYVHVHMYNTVFLDI